MKSNLKALGIGLVLFLSCVSIRSSENKSTIVKYQLYTTFKVTDTLGVKFAGTSKYIINFPIHYLYDVSLFDSLEMRDYFFNQIIDTIYKNSHSVYFINNGIHKELAIIKDSVILNDIIIQYPDTFFNAVLKPYKYVVGKNEEIRYKVISRWDNTDYSSHNKTWCRDVWYDSNFYPVRAMICYSGGSLIDIKRIEKQ